MFTLRAGRHRLFYALSAATMLSTWGAAAHAADADASSAPGEIVVTATHKSESLQKVAISLQALSPETLSQHQVSSVTDYVSLLPSVSFSSLGPGRSEVYFRGISVDGEGQQSTAGIYLDDIPITTPSRNPDPHPYDIERVEALSGPQGTLFGASSLAGTLRIITNKAKIGKFEAGYDVELNKVGKGALGQTLEGFVNIPVNDRIAVRLVGFYEHDGGYIDNTYASHSYESVNYTINNAKMVGRNYNPSTTWGGRATATIKVSDKWTITPTMIFQSLDAHGSYNYDPRVGDLQVHDYSPTRDQDQWYQAALTIQGQIGDFDVISASGYFNRKIRNVNDYTYYTVTYDKLVAQGKVGEYYSHFYDKNGNALDPTQQYRGHMASTKITQEVRVSTPKQWPVQLTLGGFYQFQKTKTDEAYYIPGLANGTSDAVQDANGNNVSPAVGGFSSPDAYYLVETDRHYKDGAIFAEGNYNILPTVKLNGGVRYFVSDNGNYGFSGTWYSAYKAGCGFTADQPYFIHPSRMSCINNSSPFHQTGETHKASISWQVQPSKMVYFTYSTGFRPGGGNRIAPDHPYKADTLSNYELGVKTTWGRNLRINAAIYHELWNGIQYSVVPFGYQGASMITNAGNATVDGIEADFSYKLGKLTFSGSGAYNDAKLSSDFCGLDVHLVTDCSMIAATKGTRLPRQPRFKMNLNARYETTLGKYDAFFQGSMLHQSSATSDLDQENNTLLGNTAGFETFDASAGISHGNWNVSAFINNMFDNRGSLSKNTFCSIQYCSGSSRTYPVRPQFFGLKFGQRF